MSLKELSREEVNTYIKELNEKNDFSKSQFYNLALRQSKCMERERELTEKLKLKNVSKVEFVGEDIAIIKIGYEPHNKIYYIACVAGERVCETATLTFDEALLLALMHKYKNSGGFMFVAKALGMDIANYK